MRGCSVRARRGRRATRRAAASPATPRPRARAHPPRAARRRAASRGGRRGPAAAQQLQPRVVRVDAARAGLELLARDRHAPRPRRRRAGLRGRRRAARRRRRCGTGRPGRAPSVVAARGHQALGAELHVVRARGGAAGGLVRGLVAGEPHVAVRPEDLAGPELGLAARRAGPASARGRRSRRRRGGRSSRPCCCRPPGRRRSRRRPRRTRRTRSSPRPALRASVALGQHDARARSSVVAVPSGVVGLGVRVAARRGAARLQHLARLAHDGEVDHRADADDAPRPRR